MLKKIPFLAALLMPAFFAHAHEYTIGELTIRHPWSMALPPNAPAVAAYFTIENNGDAADSLISVDSPLAGQAQLHEHVEVNGLMKMQQVQAVEVAPHARVSFAPMAYHVMLLDIKDRARLVSGQRFPLTLHFQKAGAVEVQVVVQQQAPEQQHHHQH
jgi:copper(I)-binding protein